MRGGSTVCGPGDGPQGRESLKGGGGGYPPPPQHSGRDSTPKAFPYPNTSPNRISNRQKPPPNRFHIPRGRSAAALELPQSQPSPSSKAVLQGRGSAAGGQWTAGAG